MGSEIRDEPAEKRSPDAPFRVYVGPLLFLVAIFFINFLSRVIFSPLMPTIERDLKIGHDEAGSFFFLVTLGYCIGLLISGTISSRLRHRGAILFSSLALAGALFWLGLTRHPWAIRSGLLVLGLGAGFYLPSGISTLTSLVSQRHWGKAIGIHELAPNLGFIVAPLLTEVLLRWFSWQETLIVLGGASLMSGALFFLWGKGGDFPGEAPRYDTLKAILKEPSLFMMIAFFALGVGASFAIYAMLPLYLVSEKGMDRTLANTLLSLSRMVPLVTSFLAGWMTDRLGIQKTLKIVFSSSGLTTGLIGLVPVPWVLPIIFLQPILATGFFPAGFAALSKIGSPRTKNLTVSLTVPIGFLIGGGVGTAGLGLIGEAGAFGLGFVLFGGIVGGGAFLVRYLRLEGGGPSK
ncbi:MAG: MFS transporter [Desulfobacterota bacterium]|nr:MFS transporter [Thermodesulfobacteriota bacterium]